MFKIGKYILLGVWLMLSIFVASAQTFDYAETDAAKMADAPTGAELDQIENGTKVCPSFLPGFTSTNNFSVLITSSEAGDQALNEFVWVVYGGTITLYEGVSLVEAIQTNEVTTGIHRSYVRIKGGDALGTHSRITVQWDEVDVPGAWVAVQQFSEWNCTQGKWSLFTNEVSNEAPTFDPALVDIHLPYDLRANYTLALPGIDDPDNCPAGSLVYSYVVDRPTLVNLTGNDASRTLSDELEVGVNTVTWTVVNGNKTITDSYDIIVEPELHILNVAWINPSCGNSNGSVRVSNTTDLSLFSVPISYRLSSDGGSNWSAWQADPSFGALAAGTTYQIQASLLYPSGHRQVSEAYEFTLSAMTANAIDAIPTTAPQATVKKTSCNNVADGIIDIGTTVMNEQNNSVSFDGTDDHFLLNKSLTDVVTQFSVALWVKTTAQNGTLISFDQNEYFQIELSFGQVQLKSRSTDGTPNTVLVYNTLYAVNDGLWHLVLATFDGTTYKIFVDGNQAQSIAGNGSPSIGKVGSTRFGALGAGLVSQNFGGTVSGTPFSGQMAEVGLWNTVVTPENAVAMRRTGMTSVGGMTDHWILNNIPEDVATTAPHVAVFSDAGNTETPAHWARYMNSPTLATGNSPKLYSWDDDATQITGKRTGLAVGTYTFNVKDLFGCGTVSQPFVVANGDEAEPYILWNVSPHKATRQFPPVPANTWVGDSLMTSGRAADGWLYSGTQIYYTTADADAGLESWWDVTLGTSTYPINRIRIHPQADLTNFWVLVSPNDFPVGSDLAADLAVAGVYAVEYTGPAIAAGTYYDVMLPANTYGRYVRIRTSNTNQALSLYEVEVLTPYVPATERKLLLTDDCLYTFSDNDATATPIPIDDCGNTPTLTHNVMGAPFSNSLDGIAWGKGPQTVTWTVVDENGVSASYDIPYFVTDEIKPEFATDPFDGEPTVLTFCDVDPHYTFDIPKVSDNFTCTPLVSISLLRDGTSIYTVPMGSYDYDNPGTVNITEANMPAGTHVYTWRVRDASNNVATISHTYEIDTRPILRDVKVSPITCHNANNGVIYFSDVQAQAGQTVTYILRNVDDNSEITRTDPIFPSGTVPPGTYKAFIEVRGCRAEFAVRDIVFTNPAEITSLNDVTDVECYGQKTGAIDIDARGGSQTNILHLMDGTAYATAPNYSQVNLGATGMIEAWIYLDELVDGGTNWNAGIFGMPNSGNGYGLRMVNGNLRFYISTTLYSEMPAGAITHRKWFYVRGTWVGNGTRVLNLEVRDQEGASTSVDAASLTVDFTANSGGDVFIGSLGDGNPDHNLRGFVRNARIWSAPIDATVVEQNLNLTSPIDPNGTLMANYPLNAAGGNTVSNTRYPLQAGSVSGVEGTNFKRQKFAYYWLDPDGNPVAPYPHAEDITNQDAGIYTVTLYDPMGCIQPINIPIITDDKVAPTMTFFTDRTQITVLAEGDPIIRMTSDLGEATSGNAAGDCYYIPHMVTAPAPYSISEFDPRVTDGVCDADYVDVTWELLAGSDPFVDTPADPDMSSLNDRQMQGRMDIRWTATDRNSQSTSRVITYYIVDDEAPTSLTLAPVTVYVDGSCEYVVPAGSTHLIPVLTDNCGTGILQNNITGTSTLDGAVLEKRVYDVEWTYTDRILYTGQPAGSITFTHTLTVEDNTVPTPVCRSYTADLDALTATASVQSVDLSGGVADNCGDADNLVVTRNIVESTMTVSQLGGTGATNAIDGNTGTEATTDAADYPWWQIDLGVSHTVLGVHLTPGTAATLENFWILVSTTGVFENTGDWTTSGAVFGADVAYAQYVAGPIAASQLVALNKVSAGQYVRLVSAGTSTQLSLAEVEVYATTNLATATSLTVDCDDIVYIADADPTVKGTFLPIQVLLTAIDDDNNAGSCLADVTVRDNVGPEVTATNATIQLSSATGGGIYLNDDDILDLIDQGATDKCTPQSELIRRVDDTSQITCLTPRNRQVIFSVWDRYGNRTDRNINLVIEDKDAPVLVPRVGVQLELGPDGDYVIKAGDLLSDWDDNCTSSDQIAIKMNPEKVTCDLRGQNTDIEVTATDASGNSVTIDVNVFVADLLGPTFSLNAYTHIIPSSGSAPIRFDDLVKSGNLRDNCTPVDDLLRYIRYEIPNNPNEWCGYGYEGLLTTAIENVAHLANGLTGSTALAGFPRTNVNDDNPSGDVVTANQTHYSPNDMGGTYTVQYNFAEAYEFESVDALWANIPGTADGNVALSHGALWQSTTASGGDVANIGRVRDNDLSSSMTLETGTAAADAFYIEYTFTQPVMVANVRLRWAAGSDLQSNSRIEYRTSDGTAWTNGGTLINSSNGTTVLTINATQRTSTIRLYYDPVAGNTPAISEWYVYGQPSSTYTVIEPNPIAISPGEILVSHDWDYLKEVTAYENGTTTQNLDRINDENNTTPTTYCTVDNNNTSAWQKWIVYEFYEAISFTSTEVYWTGGSGSANNARIQYSSDGSSWNTFSPNFSSTATGGYQSLSLIGMPSAKYIRLNFDQSSNSQVRIGNWRVYGHPCSTFSLPIIISNLSSDDTYLRTQDITVTRNDANKGRLRDGNLGSNEYLINTGSTSYSSTDYITYSFREDIILTSLTVNWFNQNGRIRRVNVQYSIDGTTWTNFEPQFDPNANATYTYPSSGNTNIEVIIVRFSLNRVAGTTYNVRINEWIVNGYPVSGITSTGCWTTQPKLYYTDAPTVTTNIPVVPANNATIEYSSDGGNLWSATQPVTTTAFPTSVNRRYLAGGAGSVVTANALRLTFNSTNADAYVGLLELRANGRRIPQGGVNDPGACVSYTCAHSNTNQTVHLKAVDQSGNPGTADVVVPIEPYFNIETIDIKDCGYSGERFYPTISGQSTAKTYTYTWNEIDDFGTTAQQALFVQWHDPAVDACNRVGPVNSLVSYTMPNPGQEWIEFNTSACSTNPQDGNYTIRLDVRDNNLPTGCVDSKLYTFDYDGANSTAKSVEEEKYCVGDEITFKIKFPKNPLATGLANNQFWRQSDKRFYWYDVDNVAATRLSNLVSNGLITVLEGGNTYNELGSTYGDSYVKIRFEKATIDNGNVTTDLNYSYRARGLSPFDVTIYSTSIEKNAAVKYEAGYTLYILDSLETGGPYFTEDNPGWNRNVPANQKYIRLNTSGVWWYGDYSACMEKRVYRNTILKVDQPIIEAARLVNGVLSGYTTITGTGAQPFPICVRDTITYRVQNNSVFASYEWSILSDHAEPVPTGRRLAGGSGTETTMQIVWDIYNPDPAYQPRLTVKGFNSLGCSVELPTVVTHLFTDNTPPVLTCNANIQQENNPGQCGFTFTNIPAPTLITDDCNNRIKDYWCEVDFDGDGDLTDLGDIKGKNAAGTYPVGYHKITWKAIDYSNNEGFCEQFVRVLDTEVPRLSTPPANLDNLQAKANACEHEFVGTSHDVTANDICEGVVPATAKVYRFNSVSGLYDILAANQPPAPGTSLAGTIFEPGVSRITWTSTDGVDNSAYGAYPADGNKNSLSYDFTVVDRTPPTVVDADLTTDGIQLAPITANSDADQCGATFAITVPGYDAGNNLTDPDNLLSDNCTPDGSLVVEFMSRSDKAPNLTTEFPVGTTTITWRVSDTATPANRTTFTQNVVVTDVQAPTFTDATEFTDRSISYCARTNYLIPIPRSYFDNCRVMRLDYTVVNVSSGTTVSSGFIDGALYPNFNPNGTGFLTAHTFADADAVNGSNYTITWQATDAAGNQTPIADWKYNLHIEMQPRFSEVISTALSCVNNEATITVVTDAVNTATYRYDRNYTPEFKYGDSNWTTATSYTVNTGADRNIQMRVNGCLSPDPVISKIAEAVEYNISTTHTDVVCPENATGTVTLSMTGGAAGQLRFNGGAGYSAVEYESIPYGLTLDFTTQGAVEAWVYLESLADATLVSKGTSYGLKLAGSRFVFFVGGAEVSASGYDLALQHWYHVSGWWDVAGLNIRIDGSATTYNNAGSYAAVPNDDPVVIGSGFNGIIREVRIWDAPVSGAINSTTLVGTESNLMGYWPLDDGTGGSARNVCSSNGNVALPATGSNGLWNSTQPQPGTYTWTRTHDGNTTTFSTYGKSNINLTGLSMGTYTASFTDPWGCPAKTSTFKTIKATDNELPVVDLSVVSTAQLMVDENECTYTFTSTSVGGDVDRYTPSIVDASNCNYITEWRIVNEATGILEHILPGDQTTDLKLLNGRVRKVGTNGNNTVVFKISQNGMSDEITYTIVANDDQEPTAVGKFDDVLSLELSNDLYGNGNVTLLAKDFNDGSLDNCTTDPEKFNPKLASPTATDVFDPTLPSDPLWQDDAIFDCSMIGNSVQLYFQVTDESGNSNYATKAVSFNIVDKYQPVFLKNSGPGPTECATFNASGGVPAYHQFATGNSKMILLPEDYTDNCRVDKITFRLVSLGYPAAAYNTAGVVFEAPAGYNNLATDASVDKDGNPINYYEGKTEVYFILDDGYGNTKEQLVYTVTILPKPIPGGGAQPGIR